MNHKNLEKGYVIKIDEFQISEVDPWTRTPISVDIGTFAIP